MRPFSLASSSFSYGRQQQEVVWLEDRGGGAGDGLVMDSTTTAAEAAGPSSAVATAVGLIEKEHMFDKVVTPSDVGKLNRLVIPKQHAEKYFPLDSSNNDKGLLLNFEDRNGKPWRFRYSYWNSSQSYVMTKGWSRFVKEKKLDAGDIVSFQRGAADSFKDRLFIDWRRRPDSHPLPPVSFPHNHLPFSHQRSIHQQYPAAATAAWSRQVPPPSYGYSYGFYNGGSSGGEVVVNGNPCSGVSSSGIYLRPMTHAYQQEMMQRRGGMVFESVPVVQGKAAAKRLRLFGVNVDCPIDSSSSSSSAAGAASSNSATTIIKTSLQLRPSGYDNDDAQESQPEKSNKSSSSMSLDLDI